MIWLFRVLFTTSLLAAGVALFFFGWGLLDGTVSSFNGLLWMGLLAGVLGVPAAGYFLHRSGHPRIAIVVLLITALPAFGFLFFILAIMILQPRWN
jgi:hypothetical protein